MAIHTYNADARRRIADSVRFTENFGRGPQGRNRRSPINPGIVVIVDEAIAAGKIGTAKRAEGPEFDTGSDPGDDSFDVWNPSEQTVAAGARVVIYPVALKDAGTMWSIVAPFTGTSSGPTGSAVAGFLQCVEYAFAQSVPASLGSALEPTFNSVPSLSDPPIFSISGTTRFECIAACSAQITFSGVATGNVIATMQRSEDGTSWTTAQGIQLSSSYLGLTYSSRFEVGDLIRVILWGGPSTINRVSMSIFGIKE